jgi:hypothetical protein
MANFLIDYPVAQHTGTVSTSDYTTLLRTYAKSHTLSYAANGSHPWVGENIEPDKGYWMAREIMYQGGDHPSPVNCSACTADPRPRNCGGHTTMPPCCSASGDVNCNGKIIPTEDKDRGKDYNHSTFMDLIISGLVGLRAAFGMLFTVSPLADSSVEWFALDNVPYHNHNISIAWDAKGVKSYPGCSKGMCVWVDGKLVASAPTLMALNITLPASV